MNGFRRIIHIDMDAFFASVEQRDSPQLRGCPVAVGHADRRGVVATASYEARRFGVHSAMPSRQALDLCPQLQFVECRMKRYREVSDQVREIFSRYTDTMEPISIDEAFLDVTSAVDSGNYRFAVDMARAIKDDIRRELELVASAGVSYNKFLAKVASDWRKPDGLCCIHPDRALQFIDKLPVEALWGVGPATAKKMHAFGWKTCADVREVALVDLLRVFGKVGYSYYRFVRGIDDRPVRVHRERKSVGCERTFAEDVKPGRNMDRQLMAVAQELSRRMGVRHFLGSTLTLKVRFFNFHTVSRSRTRDRLWRADFQELAAGALDLLRLVNLPQRGVRLLGLSVSSPAEQPLGQEADLFHDL